MEHEGHHAPDPAHSTENPPDEVSALRSQLEDLRADLQAERAARLESERTWKGDIVGLGRLIDELRDRSQGAEDSVAELRATLAYLHTHLDVVQHDARGSATRLRGILELERERTTETRATVDRVARAVDELEDHSVTQGRALELLAAEVQLRDAALAPAPVPTAPDAHALDAHAEELARLRDALAQAVSRIDDLGAVIQRQALRLSRLRADLDLQRGLPPGGGDQPGTTDAGRGAGRTRRLVADPGAPRGGTPREAPARESR